jgi:hypothetical protein
MASLGKSRSCSPKKAEGGGSSRAGNKDQRGRNGNRDQQKKKKYSRDAESARNNKPTPYCLNRSTCEDLRHRGRDCPNTSKDEAAKLLATRVES